MTEVTKDDLMKLKEEMNKIKSENSISLNKLQALFHEELSEKLESIFQNFNTVDMKIVDIQNNFITEKTSIDKIPEILTHKKNSSEDLFSLNVRVANLQKDLATYTNKYDKMFEENLELPGVIGDSCQFSNLRSYLDVT